MIHLLDLIKDPATIMFTAPLKKGDATETTHEWAVKAINLAKSLGYKVIELHGNDVTYDNVTNAIDEYAPRLFIHYGHGCPLSLQGQQGCILNRKYEMQELIEMHKAGKMDILDIIEPVKSSCPGICKIANDPCSPLCYQDTNVNKLKGSIIHTVACHSASKLGKCAVAYGAETYVGYDDLLLFPKDSLGSDEIFGDIHFLFLEQLLTAHSVKESYQTMKTAQDAIISLYKTTKYISLPMLWDKMHMKVLGNENAMIYK